MGETEKMAIRDQNCFNETSIYDMIRNREDSRIERKSAFLFDNKNNTRNKHLEKSISKAIQGFANSYDGGILFIGVDNNGNIIGLTNDYSLVKNHNSDGFELELRNSVEKYLKDKIANEVIKISFPTIEGKEICKINICPSSKPIVLYENGNEEFYVRVGNSTKPYTPTEFIDYIKRRFPELYV